MPRYMHNNNMFLYLAICAICYMLLTSHTIVFYLLFNEYAIVFDAPGLRNSALMSPTFM